MRYLYFPRPRRSSWLSQGTSLWVRSLWYPAYCSAFFLFPWGKLRKVAQQRMLGDNLVPITCAGDGSSVSTVTACACCLPGLSVTCQIPAFRLWDTDITLCMWGPQGRSRDRVSWGLFLKLSACSIACLTLGAVALLFRSCHGIAVRSHPWARRAATSSHRSGRAAASCL